MAKTKISEFNANPALNTDIDSINIAEGCAPSGINDAIRELMSQLKDWQSGTSNDPMVIGSSGSLTLNQGTANGVAYLNGSKVVTSGSALTFDGTTLTNANTIKVQTSAGTAPKFWIGQAATSAWSIGSPASADALVFVDEQFSSEKMRLTSTGLGIGTSSPAARLSVVTASANSTAATIGGIEYGGSKRGLTIKTYQSAGGDDCGVEFNAANGLAGYGAFKFAANTTTLATLDSSGNLGLGVTPSAWSAFKAFEIASVGNSLWSAGSNDLRLATNHVYNGGNKYTVNGYAAQYIQTAGQHQFYTAASGTAGNAITFTQAMTLTASSELLVNRTSASGLGKLNVEGGADFTAGNVYMCRDSGNVLVGTTSSAGSFRFQVVNTNSSGNAVWLQNASGNDRAILVLKHDQAAGATSGAMVGFQNSAGTTVGTITSSNTATAYNTSSDYRLKNTVAPMTGALAKVALLKPCTYKWNADGSDGEGFIAHELAEVCPNAVTGDKDAVDEEGNPKYQGIDVSFLVATLTAAIQELKAEFDAYKASHP